MELSISDIAAIFGVVAPLVYKLVDFAKYLRVGDWNSVVTQAVTWAGGILTVWLLVSSDFAAAISPQLPLINGASIVFIGLSGGSVASAGYDFKKARDNKDSAVTPSLLPDPKQVAA